MSALCFETKLWMINKKGEAVFGNGLAELLEEIDKHHSIKGAAEQLSMSYRYALHRITLAEGRQTNCWLRVFMEAQKAEDPLRLLILEKN